MLLECNKKKKISRDVVKGIMGWLWQLLPFVLNWMGFERMNIESDSSSFNAKIANEK